MRASIAAAVAAANNGKSARLVRAIKGAEMADLLAGAAATDSLYSSQQKDLLNDTVNAVVNPLVTANVANTILAANMLANQTRKNEKKAANNAANNLRIAAAAALRNLRTAHGIPLTNEQKRLERAHQAGLAAAARGKLTAAEAKAIVGELRKNNNNTNASRKALTNAKNAIAQLTANENAKKRGTVKNPLYKKIFNPFYKSAEKGGSRKNRRFASKRK